MRVDGDDVAPGSAVAAAPPDGLEVSPAVAARPFDGRDPADGGRPCEGVAPAAGESFRLAFEQAPIGIAVLVLGEAGERRIERANPVFAELFGLADEDPAGRDLAEFAQPENAEEDLRVAAELRSGRRTTYSRHKRYRRADGGSFWAEVRVQRVSLPGIEGITLLAHYLDVTERHETEQLSARQAAVNAAVADVVTRVLAGAPDAQVHELVADSVAGVFDADNVTLGLADERTGLYSAVAAVGEQATRLLTGEVTPNQPFIRRMVALGSFGIAEDDPDLPWALRGLLGPAAAVRFGGTSRRGGGLIAAARRRGADPFTPAEIDLLAVLAQQIALAVELGRARADQQRLAVLEDRQRIARDLHDTVIQDIIAVGMQLDAGLAREPDADRRCRDGEIVDQLEEAVLRLRGSVFDLRQTTYANSLPDSVRAVAAQAARVLGHRPEVVVEGYPDLVAPAVASAVLAVLREALSNVARHAGAGTTTVRLAVRAGPGDGEVTLIVDDDGRGLPDQLVPGDGLANVRARASALGGYATVADRPGGGTRLCWTCPLDKPVAP